mmetsp:Transcript_77478/g.121933  ORF Transcript_77478/g.121933 Transcript_77478/m.121933 type:complete len:159 (+) Transcript_77478:70-546(+)
MSSDGDIMGMVSPFWPPRLHVLNTLGGRLAAQQSENRNGEDIFGKRNSWRSRSRTPSPTRGEIIRSFESVVSDIRKDSSCLNSSSKPAETNAFFCGNLWGDRSKEKSAAVSRRRGCTLEHRMRHRCKTRCHQCGIDIEGKYAKLRNREPVIKRPAFLK